MYWHGSSASRMLRAEAQGIPVCLTVTHMDAIVLARCGFNHSINYRSVMAFGRAHKLEGREEKKRAMDAFIDRFFPGAIEGAQAAYGAGDQGDNIFGDGDGTGVGEDP